MANLADVAATLHKHLCDCSLHGYNWDLESRWGNDTGSCTVRANGMDYYLPYGDRDCSSSVIECWSLALTGTPYEGALDGATNTEDMKAVFTGSGLFAAYRPWEFTAQRGDIYLNEVYHAAMCQSANPDMLTEFFHNENYPDGDGDINSGGIPGDQTGLESDEKPYYDYSYGWDWILHYNGGADAYANPARSTQIFGSNNTDAQRWRFEPIENRPGYYRIKAVCNNMYLDLRDGQAHDLAPVRVHDYVESDQQVWKFEFHNEDFDKWVYIQSAVNENYSLFAHGTEPGDGTGVYQRTNYNAQKWGLVWAGAPWTYFLVNLGSGMFLDVVASGR